MAITPKDAPKVFLVELSYDQKFVMDLDALTNLLGALCGASGAFEKKYQGGSTYSFKEIDNEITIRLISTQKLKELQLEETISNGTTQ